MHLLRQPRQPSRFRRALVGACRANIRARTRPVAARDYWEASRLRRYLAEQVFRAVLVDRAGNLGQLRTQIDQLIAALDAGDSLILFPEGTRGTRRDDRAIQERARLPGPPAA